MGIALEFKDISVRRAELKLSTADGARPVTISGYASTFGGEPDGYGDLIAPGAYTSTLSARANDGHVLQMKFDHHAIIGHYHAVHEDAKGLFVEGTLAHGHALAADVAALLKHGSINGLSIGFRTKNCIIDQASGVRTLTEIDLAEVSIVGDPANRSARIASVKSADSIHTIRDFEQSLREQGWSQREAAILATRGFKALAGHRDDGDPDAGDDGDRDGARRAGLEMLAALRAVRPY